MSLMNPIAGALRVGWVSRRQRLSGAGRCAASGLHPMVEVPSLVCDVQAMIDESESCAELLTPFQLPG